MKILILSDIHANYQALTAINEEADLVFCLGDIVNYGPNPEDCLAWVRRHATKMVRGNHDNAVGRGVDCGCSIKYKELSDAGKAFTMAALNDGNKKFLGSLPIAEHIEISPSQSPFTNPPVPPFSKGGSGGINFLLSHGSPSGDMYKYLRPETSDAELLAEIGAEKADFVFIGHTHLPMVRKLDGVTVVNPGSVGQPRDGVPLCSYAVWEDGDVEIKRVEYDIEATINAYKATGISRQHVGMLSQILRNGGMPVS